MGSVEAVDKTKEHDKKTVTIIVNGRPHEVEKVRLSYEEVVALSGMPSQPAGDGTVRVSYRRGPERNREGTLLPGKSVRVKEGMIFDVHPTNKS